MKLTKYFMPLAAVALLASCSDDKVIDQPIDNPQNGLDSEMVAMFTINLPSANDTRAIENENDFEEGLAEENAIKNVKIYVFKADAGKSEDEYEYVTASSTFYPENKPGQNEVQQQATVYLQLPEEEIEKETNTFYGLCVVNVDESGQGRTIGNNFIAPDGSYTGTGTSGAKTFKDWKKAVMTAQNESDAKGFFMAKVNNINCFTMTNAPTWGYNGSQFTNPAIPGQEDTFTTLVLIDKSEFVKSPTLPENSAGTFYVQRGLAKVRVTDKNGAYATNNEQSKPSLTLDSDVATTHKFLLQNWKLDVTNLKSYPVQNVSSVYNEYTLAGTGLGSIAPSAYFFTPVKNSVAEFNHIWWGDDPNYDAGWSTSGITGHFWNLGYEGETDDTEITNGVSETDFEYCLENTMAYSEMNKNQSTRVVFKGIYTLDGTTAASFAVNPENDLAFDIEKYVKDNYQLNEDGSIKLINILKEGRVDEDGKILEGEPQEGKAYKEILEYVTEALQMHPSGEDNVYFYEGGVTYYTAIINHFHPSSETPWSDDATKKEAGVGTNGKTEYKAGHLGRYGLLRNNVYEIKANKVLGYGSPTVPTPDNTPDDDPEVIKWNLKVDVKVLQWAKRSYGYDLK